MATVSSTTAPAGASGDEAAGSAEATGAGDESSDSSSLPVLALGAALVVLVAGGAVWMRRRRA
jgi:cobalamin biosynthesis Mg chelatase CobN